VYKYVRMIFTMPTVDKSPRVRLYYRVRWKTRTCGHAGQVENADMRTRRSGGKRGHIDLSSIKSAAASMTYTLIPPFPRP
jgi:hypothetical protein